MLYNIITVRNTEVINMEKLEKILDQLIKILRKFDKLVYRLIQIAGTIGILIMAIKAWFT